MIASFGTDRNCPRSVTISSTYRRAALPRRARCSVTVDPDAIALGRHAASRAPGTSTSATRGERADPLTDLDERGVGFGDGAVQRSCRCLSMAPAVRTHTWMGRDGDLRQRQRELVGLRFGDRRARVARLPDASRTPWADVG